MSPVRVITIDDLPAVMRLKEAAGWNQTEQDWRNVMRLEPEGCLGVECGGQIVATATAVCFGKDLAWIGMVLTDPAWRGKGFARCLMREALAFIAARGVGRVKLDATDMGKPLYCSLGFEDETTVERLGRAPGPCEGPDFPALGEIPYALDREAFGADRAKLLELLAPLESACGPDGGYAMGRSGAKAAYFGPCVSRSRDEARQLLRWFLARHAGETVYWDVLGGNPDALELAVEFGFEPLRKLSRQSLGGPAAPPFVHNDRLVFGIAGFEFG
ncbi:MAG TPA: GNAT family N-acetyltransferase [Bryobacteraceae bacterium]|nr:GNAT family N-acetyltransferase [Bryobacteraceae bacterium]